MLARARFALLMLLILNILNAKSLLNDHLISPKAADVIEKMGAELKNKTGINGYLIATNDKIKRGVSVYEYISKYSGSISEPFVAIVFAPNSKRIHLISKPKDLLNKLNKNEILDYAIKVIASEDSNSLQSKYDVGLVQAYSEMADEIAKAKGIKLDSTIKNSGGWVLKIVNTLIIIGSLIVIWIYFVNPIIIKIKGK
jgi:hypothetical protein